MRKTITALALAAALPAATAALPPPSHLATRDIDLTKPGYDGVYDPLRNVTLYADPIVSGRLDPYQATSFIAGFSIAGVTDWQFVDFAEFKVGLWDEWYFYAVATSPDFDGDGIGDGLMLDYHADAGLGSHLFKTNPNLVQRFWSGPPIIADRVADPVAQDIGVWMYGSGLWDSGYDFGPPFSGSNYA
jgi:hypothetical protein